MFGEITNEPEFLWVVGIRLLMKDRIRNATLQQIQV